MQVEMKLQLEIFKSGRFFQHLAAISGAFVVISAGINLGWTSPYLPTLLDDSSSISLTSDEGSWCAVMPLLGAPPGSIAAAILADKIGRKYTTLLLAPIVFFSFIFLAFANSFYILCFIRFLLGSVEGALFTALPMYIGEICEPEIRGLLSSLMIIAIIVGTLFINIIGPILSVFTSSLICSVIPLLHFIVFIWMPESPYFYIKKHMYVEARESLKILRGNVNEDEYTTLCKVVAKQEMSKSRNIMDLFRVKSNRKACFIYIIVTLTNKFSGKTPCLFYTTMIFDEAGSNFSSNISVIIYCSVELIVTGTAIVFIDKCGKKPLFIISTIGCCLSLFILATHFYLIDFFPAVIQNLGWLPIAALISYNIFFSFGLEFSAVSVLSELFPTNIKAVALCAADTFSVIIATLVSKFFQITKDEFGMYVPFWCFSACCAIGLVFIIKYVPETKGKSLGEIQELLMGESNCENKPDFQM